MTFLQLFFSFKGRASRMQFWLVSIANLFGLVALVICSAALIAAAGKSKDATAVQNAIVLVALIGFTGLAMVVWSNASVSVKRLHDRGKSGWLYLVFLLPNLMAHGSLGMSMFGVTQAGATSHLLVLVAAVVSLWALVELGFMPAHAEAGRFERGALPKGAHTPEDDFAGSWADRPIEEMARMVNTAKREQRAAGAAAARACAKPGFGRRAARPA
ncbi:MAG: DUF805 domain-containing protein [Pseudomonadota bacterium]